MGLFGLFGRKTSKSSSNKNSFGERMDRLTTDGELPWGWAYANKEFTEKIQKEYNHFNDAYFKSKKKGVLQEYAALKSLVIYTEDVKKLCRSKGECFVFWYSNILTSHEYLAELKAKQKDMEERMDELIQQENTLKKLRTDLKKIIRNEPGVIQAAIYKRFSPDMKHHISNELYLMVANGIIERKKDGRSYALYLKQK